MGWIAHFVPFHLSASGIAPTPVEFAAYPTAVQAVRDTQDTALRLVLFVPGGLGAGWIAHFAPFQAMASGTSPSGICESPTNPTAVQAVRDTQDTPLR
jgi:hypothetical protein